MTRIGWFVGIWGASVLSLGILSLLLRAHLAHIALQAPL
ncbi:DUF2474 family protein [Novosphingobium guangzhouense]|nr:DUF2474 family protein [Novosphingobium guangzhouense]